jgi:glucosyl-3-phosphoglycerate synthase
LIAPGRSPESIASFDHSQYRAAALVEAKHGRSVSVCLPARNEEATVGDIVAVVRRDLIERVRLVDEIVVVDDGSTDRTADHAARAGARVVTLIPTTAGAGDGSGKGQALARATVEATGDIVVFLDADVRNFGPHFVTGLLGPLLLRPEVAFVKAFYRRPLHGRRGEGGRVSELVARPLLARLFPHLSGVVQPLAGECAAQRRVLEEVDFADGYGVELAMLIDVARRFGVGCLAQVDLGERVHRNRPLAELRSQAAAVLDVALARAGIAGVDGYDGDQAFMAVTATDRRLA